MEILGIIYIVLTDLHLYTKLNARYDYFSEMEAILDQIVHLVNGVREPEYKIVVIFAGDVVHRSLPYTKDYMKVHNQIARFLKHFDESYINFGNHEITYQANNPVLSFISKINHPTFKAIRKSSLGDLDLIKAVDRISHEDFNIDFYHYGSQGIMPDTSKETYAIAHGTILNQDEERFVKEAGGYVHGYDILQVQPNVIFTGHEHTIVSTKMINNGRTEVINMGSLGRTSVTEVRDDFNKRLIPVIKVTDNKFDNRSNLVIELHPRASIVDEEKVLTDKTRYKKTKLNKRALQHNLSVNITIEDLFGEIEDELTSEFGKAGKNFFKMMFEEDINNDAG